MRLHRTTSASPRRPLRALAGGATALALSLTLPVAAARADEPAGQDTVVGELVQAWPEVGQAGHAVEAGHEEAEHEEAEHEEAEHGDGGHGAEVAEAPLTWVQSASGEAVRVPTEAVDGLPVGSTVEVTVGEELSDAAGEDGYEPARDVLDTELLEEAPKTSTPRVAGLTNQVTVAMAVPAGGQADGTTLAQVVAAVDGPVAEFWAGETDGAVRLGVTAAHDWVQTDAACADPTALWNEVADRTGFVPGPGRHLVAYVSSLPRDLPGCSYALGQVGAGPGAGGRIYVRDVLPSVIAHELGHNFGLGHSSAHQCDGAVETGACRTAPYRDYYDVMGASWSRLGSLNAPQAAQLGVLPASAQLAVPAAGPATTVTLAPLSGRAGTRAVRLTDAAGGTYWLEHRAAAGRDAWLDSADNRFGLESGVLLRRTGGMPDTALLLDGTPSAAAGWDADLQTALPVGVPVPVAGGAFTVTVDAVTAAGATLTVTPAPGAAVPVTPLPEGDPAPEVLAAGPAGAVPAREAPADVDTTAGAPGVVPPGTARALDPVGTPAATDAVPEAAVVAAAQSSAGGRWALAARAAGGLGVVAVAGWGFARMRVRTRS